MSRPRTDSGVRHGLNKSTTPLPRFRRPEEPLTQGNVLQRTLATADTNVVLGSDTRKVRLTLGTCTYPLGAHSILYFPNTEVGGMGMKVPGNAGTTITYAGQGQDSVMVVHFKHTGVYNVFLHDFSITGDGAAGSIGIDMTYALVSTLERISTDGSDNGWKFGGTATCSCYNQIIQVLAFDRSRGGWLGKTANQNQIFGGAVRANNSLLASDWILMAHRC